MLYKKRRVEANHRRPKIEFAELFRQHPPAHFWEPIINGGKNREKCAAKKHIMKMRHQIIGACYQPVDWHHRKGDAAESPDGELNQKCHGKKHGGGQANRAAPQGGAPGKYFYPRGHGNQEARG